MLQIYVIELLLQHLEGIFGVIKIIEAYEAERPWWRATLWPTQTQWEEEEIELYDEMDDEESEVIYQWEDAVAQANDTREFTLHVLDHLPTTSVMSWLFQMLLGSFRGSFLFCLPIVQQQLVWAHMRQSQVCRQYAFQHQRLFRHVAKQIIQPYYLTVKQKQKRLSETQREQLGRQIIDYLKPELLKPAFQTWALQQGFIRLDSREALCQDRITIYI